MTIVVGVVPVPSPEHAASESTIAALTSDILKLVIG